VTMLGAIGSLKSGEPPRPRRETPGLRQPKRAASCPVGVNTNQRLWILRCSMDVQHYDKATERMVPGEHIKEWSGVALRVEEMVRLEAKASSIPLTSFNGNSLEILAKNHNSPMDNGKWLDLICQAATLFSAGCHSSEIGSVSV